MVHPLADHDNLLVIVFNIANQSVGLLAIGPIDALEIGVEIDDITLKQTGIMGSVIIDKHTTMLVNVFELVQTLFPSWFENREIFDVETVATGEAPTILIAEDSNFFRNQVRGYMTEAGYNVLEGEDGRIAWHVLQEHKDKISMLVTDIEMPNMNGFDLVRNIKSHSELRSTPVIALTSLSDAESRRRGMKAGFDEYAVKIDKDSLLDMVFHHLQRRPQQ
jgi:two-component system chemotaxis sensor kinase CheA